MDTIAAQQHQRLKAKLERELGPVMLSALADPNVIEVMLNPDGWIWTDAHGQGLACTGQQMDAMQAENLLGTIAAILGTVITPDVPIVEGELPFSLHRIAGLLPPVVPGPTLSIRKHAPIIYPLSDYLADWQLAVLQDAIRSRHNIVVAGGTSSGKTSLTNALLQEMVRLGDPNDRFVLIEDTYELQCAAPNTVRLHTSDVADMNRLLRATLRLRPDRIIPGEVRGPEALTLLKAWNTGHPGGITTLHANSAPAALERLHTLVQEAGVPPQPGLVAQAVDLLVFIALTPAGRKVRQLMAVPAYDAERGFALVPFAEPATERN